jgi:hypothetical protein
MLIYFKHSDDLEFSQRIFDLKFNITDNLDQYINSSDTVKIAWYPYEYFDNNQQVLKEIANLSNCSNVIFVKTWEMHESHLLYSQSPLFDNVYWLGCGHYKHNRDKSIPWLGDLIRASDIYRQIPQVLEPLLPYSTKLKNFDALLGLPKPHRTFVFESFKKHNLLDQSIVSYDHNARLQSDFYAKDWWVWEPGTEPIPNEPLTSSSSHVKYAGIELPMSFIIPVQTYNQTYFSVVAETEGDKIVFLTEKTAKPLIAKRLFVMFSSAGTLAYLKKSGFKTFDSIIDEQYDLIENPIERWTAAFEQVIALSKMDKESVLEKIKPIVEHNYHLIMETDLKEITVNAIKQRISNDHSEIQLRKY